MNRRIYISIALLLGLFFLDACKVGPNYQKIEVPTETNYRFNTTTTEADTILNLRWWELFNDPVLDTLVVTALRNNKNTLIAASRVEQARANVSFNKADMGPKFGLNAGATRGNYANGFGHLNSTTNNYTGTAVANWELDFWGKYKMF